jgi:hypothetical protein
MKIIVKDIDYNIDIKYGNENYEHEPYKKDYDEKIYDILKILDENYSPLVNCSKCTQRKNILVYNNINGFFPIVAIYFYYNLYKKTDDSFLVISNRLVHLEVLLYYNITNIGMYPLYDRYDDKYNDKFNNLLTNMLSLYKNNNVIIEKNDSTNKYKNIIVWYSETNEHNNNLHVNIRFLNNILLALKFLYKKGNLILRLPYINSNFIKQIVYLVGSKFRCIKYKKNPFYDAKTSNVNRVLIIFKYYYDLNFNDIIYIISKINKDVTLPINNLLSVKYDNKFDKFYEKVYKIIDKKDNLQKIYNKLSNDDKFNNITIDLINNIKEKKFLSTIEYCIFLCEKSKLKVKEEYKLTNNNYQNLVTNENLKNPQIIYYNLSKYNIEINIENKLNFDELKNELNLMKFYINTRKDKKKWKTITKKINISRYFKYYLQNKLNLKVSSSFCKIFEILSMFNLIDLSTDLNSLHICELPGNFISAINHFYRQHNKTNKFNWFGNSLNPNNEINIKKYGNILDDSEFLKKYPDKWLWGNDGTGDITNIDNIQYFMNKYNEIDFFTSDCGLECKNDMLNQEKNMSLLNICQIFIGLLVLKIGGNAIFKVFLPLVEDNTISYIKLLTKYFDDIIFIKQASGTPESSEIYIIAKNKLKHLKTIDKDMIFEHIKNFDNKPLNISIDNIFLSKLFDITKKLIKNQTNYLYKIFYYYDNPDIFKKDLEKLENIKKSFAKDWIKMININNIPSNYKL